MRSPAGWRCSIRSTCCGVGGASRTPPTAPSCVPSPTCQPATSSITRLADGEIVSHVAPSRRSNNRDQRDNPATPKRSSELDAILRELESSDVDVDRLAERVARAAELIALCRDRISTARIRIDEVIADLDTPDTESP